MTEQATTDHSSPPGMARRSALVIYTEDHHNLPAVIETLQAGGRYDVTLLLPRWMRLNRLPAVTVCDALQASSRPSRTLANFELIVLPSMPSGLLRQLLSASAESHTAQLLRVARRLGKPLVTCAAEPVTWQKRDSTIDNQQECLKGLGIALVTVAELAEPTIAIAKLPSCQSCLAPTTCADRCQWRVKDIIAEGATRIGAGNGNISAARKLARFIDHTLLKPEAIEADIRKLCAEAREHCFASVCINPTWVSLAADLLKGSPVQVCTVIGFPLGATDPATKAFEAREAASNGASEIDMVINVGALKSKNYRLVEDDIHQVARAVPRGTIVKVILETSLLSDEEKVAACLLAKRAGADFVKTSTGFGGGGATTSDIILMRTAVGPELGVKASGGVRDAKTATEMLAAGATRIGASASVAIVKGASGKEQY